MKRYVIDLDQTLCITKKNKDGSWNYLQALPIPERINKINKLANEGNYIIIETARGFWTKRNWYMETYNQLISWGLLFHELRTGVKFYADYYIDDKAINDKDFFNE
jgi:hypothetical protein